MNRIDISGVIVSNDEKGLYDWYGYESTAPKDVKEVLDCADGSPVDVYINSGGGNVFDGATIYSYLKEYRGEVHIHVIGLAASAASIIAMARDSEIEPPAMLMVHNVTTVARGDYREMEKTADTLKEINQALASAYSMKSGMSEEEVLEMMDDETWLTASAAVEKGLIDRISTTKAQSQPMVAAYGVHVLTEKQIETAKAEMQKESTLRKQRVVQNIKILKMKGEKSND